jgi:hypothetical protein
VPAFTGSGPITISTPNGKAISAADFYIPPPPFIVSDIEFTSRITIGITQAFAINTASKVGLITFSAVAGQRISLGGVVTSGFSAVWGCDVFVSILKPDSTTLVPKTCMDGSALLDATTLPTTAAYTMVLDPVSTSTGSISLTMHNILDVTGTITAGGATVVVATTTPGQNGLLTFSGTAGQRVSVNGTNSTGFLSQWGCDVHVSLRHPDGSLLAPAVCMEDEGFIDATTLPTTGTYAIKFDPVSSATGGVTLALYTVSDLTGAIAAGGSAVTMVTATPGQNSSLTFSGTAGQRVSLRGTSASGFGGSYSCDLNVSIANPDDSPLTSVCMESGGFIDATELPSTGTYKVILNPLGPATGSITLTLYDVPANASTTLTVGGSGATLTTNTPGQNAHATFSGVAAAQVTVRLTSNSMGSTTVKLLKPDGSLLTSKTSSAGSFNLVTQTLPVSGTYTVSVDPGGVNIGSIVTTLTSP